MRDKYATRHDKYCYAGTDILINLLHIHDADKLARAEAAFTAERYLTYKSTISSIEEFTLDHLKHLHFHLFQDIYSWAGKIRDVDISKGHTRFCTSSRIEPEAKKLFGRLPELSTITNRSQLIESVADLFCEINLLHPFREGNGRVQRLFFEEMLFILDYELIWPSISRQQWLEANIAGVHMNLSPLIHIFDQAISRHIQS
ncbi:Fic/DOC family protein [Vibrio salinus]|uniref:Fic/DOC family protein n=1 Tax=Vibrio salinus TaxID=2899784 RepID=UPI001E4554CB|nr:Fic family protein [Vibrio salinus]MCE0492930.1 Fic family protein [Vibrio salinus]